MSQRTLNLGILAHVDAGKTTLTERLLHTAGVIDEVGSVDDGTTQTDTLLLERQRGITIKSAVASFAVGELTLNLIDTPGHPDFIAEVERALVVLDGAVLVVSAVEGVQAQTRILMRALRRVHIPTIIFVNKTDRRGADSDAVLRAITERLSVLAIPMGSVDALGTADARFSPFGPRDPAFRSLLVESLALHNDQILAAYIREEPGLSYARLRDELASQTRAGEVFPVFFGSAITGDGAGHLTSGITELLQASRGDPAGPLSAAVFKVERDTHGHKVAYARLFSGTIRERDRLHFGGGLEEKVTAITVFGKGTATPTSAVSADAVAKLWGLGTIRVGDVISGSGDSPTSQTQFALPTLEALVVPEDASDRSRLWVALTQLAEQDPLIAVRRNDERREISVSLYGEVQREVIGATLENDFGVRATFREATPICIERPLATGEAVEYLNSPTNPFAATMGLRVAPATAGAGLDFRIEVGHEGIPLRLYKRLEDFTASMEQYVTEALVEGLHGWRVTDCAVTMTVCDYSRSDGPPSQRGPMSTAMDFRRLTAVVLMQALSHAGVAVCAPVVSARLEIPARSTGALVAVLSRLGAAIQSSVTGERFTILDTVLSVTRAGDLQRKLSGLTSGEGTLETRFAGYQPVLGSPPSRARASADPLNLREYLRSLGR